MFKKVAIVLIGSIAVLLIAFVAWALWIPQPLPEALASLSSTETVEFGSHPYLHFKSRNSDSKIGFIIYPGARVDSRAYAPLAKKVSESGVTVIVPTMPFNLAIFAPERAMAIKLQFPEVESWYIGGHSLGGTMAASFAENNPDIISGLILMASYPISGSKLAHMNIRVVSIFGSSDGIATVDEVSASGADLPAKTRFVEIKGGNHSRFGWYGEQRGDGAASISRDEQTRAVAESIVQFIRENGN